ncbi:hypothetical protein ABER61_22800 [Brevibacillus formosus]|uniref:Uncharacterized protein n=1 Tax=Brevibacillus formosus TaxID=54913 RepID=A0A837KGW8_9BACL|nr:hypothetical protein [Brevibacillus formosus]KLH96321.1 hypothetical protein AA984_26525 [Brevibacillus formosus]MED1959135.1 hypothetical protein [Brevibacillus formosus]PSJ91033.1 hypothetical protein C7R91_26075 [Brevibacillus formosus]GED59885.1 hypothetical protein BFO01nite_40170 [Brevibacillus formosus]
MNPSKRTIAELHQELPALVDKKMGILIQDLADDAEPHSPALLERQLAKWEITEDEEYLRLYFNPCQFVAIPIQNGPIVFSQEDDCIRMVARDNRGQLAYHISFGN